MPRGSAPQRQKQHCLHKKTNSARSSVFSKQTCKKPFRRPSSACSGSSQYRHKQDCGLPGPSFATSGKEFTQGTEKTFKLSFATSGKEVAQGTDLREACVNLLLKDLDNALGVFQLLDCDGQILEVPDEHIVLELLPQSRYTHLNEAQVVRRDPPEVVMRHTQTSKPVGKVQMSPGTLLFWQARTSGQVMQLSTHVQEVVKGMDGTTQLNVKWLEDLKKRADLSGCERHNFRDTWMPKSVLGLQTCCQCKSFTTSLGASMNLWAKHDLKMMEGPWRFCTCYHCEKNFKVHCGHCHVPLFEVHPENALFLACMQIPFAWCASCIAKHYARAEYD